MPRGATITDTRTTSKMGSAEVASSSRTPPPRARCSQLRWRPIAALRRPFRRTPGRLSRAYHSQEEGLEMNLWGYRPTIFVLHRGRWGTGEFRRQPFSDLWVSCKRMLRFRRIQLSTIRLLRIFILQLHHKIHKSDTRLSRGLRASPRARGPDGCVLALL